MNSNTRAGACGIQRSRAFTEQGVAALQRIGFDSLRSQIAILNAARKSNGAASPSINGTESGQGCAPSGRGNSAKRGGRRAAFRSATWRGWEHAKGRDGVWRGMAQGGRPAGSVSVPLLRGRRMPRGVTASFAGADACKPWGRTLPPRRPPGGTGKGGKTPPVLGELAVSAPVPTRPLSLCGVRIPFRVSVCIRQQVQHGRRWRFPLC